jgi:putative flippase GtrA
MDKLEVRSERRGVHFIICGLINTGITYIIYLLLERIVNYQIAYVIAYATGIIFSYWLNTVIVFQTKLAWKKFFKYPLVYLAQYGLSAGLMGIMVTQLHFSKTIAPLVILIITIPITYFLSKLIIVTKTKHNAGPDV